MFNVVFPSEQIFLISTFKNVQNFSFSIRFTRAGAMLFLRIGAYLHYCRCLFILYGCFFYFILFFFLYIDIQMQ